MLFSDTQYSIRLGPPNIFQPERSGPTHSGRGHWQLLKVQCSSQALLMSWPLGLMWVVEPEPSVGSVIRGIDGILPPPSLTGPLLCQQGLNQAGCMEIFAAPPPRQQWRIWVGEMWVSSLFPAEPTSLPTHWAIRRNQVCGLRSSHRPMLRQQDPLPAH